MNFSINNIIKVNMKDKREKNYKLSYTAKNTICCMKYLHTNVSGIMVPVFLTLGILVVRGLKTICIFWL